MGEAVTSKGKEPTAWMGRIVRFPVTRILLFIVGIAAALWLARFVNGGLGREFGAWWPGAAANVVLQIVAVHVVYRGMVRLLEARSAAELCLRGAARETGAGALVGVGCLTVTVGLVAALGYYHVEGVGGWAGPVTALGIAAGSGYIEEVIFRGVVFRIAEEALGT